MNSDGGSLPSSIDCWHGDPPELNPLDTDDKGWCYIKEEENEK
jgi:hypothetical protein